MPESIKKAIFPAAGLGTRFLPATKASPKEMLPIVDKPMIQYGVEEAIACGGLNYTTSCPESQYVHCVCYCMRLWLALLLKERTPPTGARGEGK